MDKDQHDWMQARISSLEVDFKEFKRIFEKEKEDRTQFVLETTKILTVIDLKVKLAVVLGGAFFGFVLPRVADYLIK